MADLNFSLIDLKGWGEPASKLIDAVRSATGVRYEPTRIRRRAKAEADATIIVAKADAEASEIAQRAAHRLSYRELQRQKNIDAVVDSAMKQLPDSVTKEPVDDDWLAGFFDHCQDVSGEQLQELWGKLLAGEVARPGSFSLRTLALVKVLQASDARLFTKLCRFVWRIDSIPVIPEPEHAAEFLKSAGLHDRAMGQLKTLGLIQEGMGMNIPMHAGEALSVDYQGWEHVLALPDKAGNGKIHVIVLSDVGDELARVVSVEPVEEYRAAIVAKWRKMSFDVKELPPNDGHNRTRDGDERKQPAPPPMEAPEILTVD